MRSIIRKIFIVMTRLSQSVVMTLVSLLAIAAGPRASRLQRPLLRIIGIKTKDKVFFGHKIFVFAPDRLYLGDRISIGDNSHIACHAPIYIGDDFLAAPGLFLNSGAHDVQTLEGYGKPIRIGARVWCGVRVTICAGVVIGDDVVIGAGAVVVRSIPSGCVAAGVPAIVISKVERDFTEGIRSCFD